MVLTELRLRDFRNYEELTLRPAPGRNLFSGENAQGKTNLLEAVFLLSGAKSFRAGRDAELLRFGAEEALVSARVFTGGREQSLDLRLGARRQTLLNGVRQRRGADWAGRVRTVLFCPEDLELWRDGAAARRRFMDTALCQLRPAYSAHLAEYQRLLAHMGVILRTGEQKPSLLDTLDDFAYRLCAAGACLVPYRAAFCEALSRLTREIHGDISEGRERLTLSYRAASGLEDPGASAAVLGRQLWAHWQSHRDAALRAGQVLTGPHRDDILFCVDGREARSFASQGQVRTAALACKLGERQLFCKLGGEHPILLLDDVLSELDARRRAFVLEGIREGQVFITACDPPPAQKDETARTDGRTAAFYVQNGRIRALRTAENENTEQQPSDI